MSRGKIKLNKNTDLKVSANKAGSAIILVLFILSTVMIIIFASSSVVISGLKMGRIQSDSTHAYYAAESGAEKLLYSFRKRGFLEEIITKTPPVVVIAYERDTPYYSPWSYEVEYNSYSPLIFTSIGSYAKTRRSVEITFY